MTNLSPIKSTGVLVSNLQKGSTHGEQTQIHSRCYSFQQPPRNGGSYCANGTQVLYWQAALFPLLERSIILVNA